jgi:stringent starvation protein B
MSDDQESGATTPTKPYLIRAIREWATDNGFTPQILVDTGVDGVSVPPGYAKDGQITLNVDERAVHNAVMGNEWLRFSARFGGRPFNIEVPVSAVMAIFARENGHGFIFKSEGPTEPEPTPPEETNARKKASHLRVIK